MLRGKIPQRDKRNYTKKQSKIAQYDVADATAPWRNDDDGTAIVTVTLPKMIIGHPTLGAIPVAADLNPTWEL